MTNAHAEFNTVIGDEVIAEMAASAKAVAVAMDKVRELHPGYKFIYADEIRCDGWACSRGLDVESGRMTPHSADLVYAEHQANELDLLLVAMSNHNDDAPEHQR